MPFHNLGLLIGLFSPRCADLWPATRQEAVSCVHSLLYLQLGYEGEPLAGLAEVCRGEGQSRGLRWPRGAQLPPRPLLPAGFSRDYQDDVAERLLTLKDGLVHPDPAILFHTCHSIAQVPGGVSSLGSAGTGTGCPHGAGWLGTRTGHMVSFHSEKHPSKQHHLGIVLQSRPLRGPAE